MNRAWVTSVSLSRACLNGFSIFVVISLGLMISTVEAKEFRRITRIFSPVAIEAKAGQEMVSAAEFIPVNSDIINDAAGKIASSFNSPQIHQYLSESFFDKDRLSDTINNLVPKDAVVRVISVRDTQTVQQYIEKDEATQNTLRVSRVAVTINTQLEFNDSAGDFQAFPGTTQYVLKFKEVISEGGV